MISFDCQCGKPFRFSLKFRGRPFRCNVCGQPLVVPEESQTSDNGDTAAVGSGEIIAPVKPVLQLDLGALPASLNGKAIDEHEEDEIIISESLLKAKGESAFHVDFDIDDSDEEDSTSTILSKAAIANKIKAEQEQIEATPDQKPAKKAGLLSGIFKKKPKTTDATEKPAAKAKEKASKKQPKAKPVADPGQEKPKKAGFLSGLFKKKPKVPKTVASTDGEAVKPAPAPKKEKVKKTGFLSGLFKKKPKNTDAD